jgi:hypothetical protein
MQISCRWGMFVDEDVFRKLFGEWASTFEGYTRPKF